MTRHQVNRRRSVLPAVLAVVLTTAGCTAGASSSATSPPATSATSPTVPATASSTPPPTPVSTGPTRSARASDCPLVKQSYVHPTIGMRLGRVTVQRSGGRVVGCRFYALQGGPLHRSEHLPGPHQPAVEVTTTQWRTATGAHNAFVLRAEAGRNDTQVALGGGTVGLCFQTAFDPHDHGRDFACAASRNTLELLVRTVDTTDTLSPSLVTRAVLRALAP